MREGGALGLMKKAPLPSKTASSPGNVEEDDIAGILGAQQEGDGEDACVGFVGVITVAPSIIPDIIRCTFGPDHARAGLLVTQLPIFRTFQGISSQCHLRALDEYLSIVV